MIKTFLLWIFILLILCIALPLFVAIALFGTILWPIRAILYGIEKMFSKDKKEEDKKSNKLLEFIFLCYGIAITCLIFPFNIFDDWND